MLASLATKPAVADVRGPVQLAATSTTAARTTAKAWWLTQGRIIARSNALFRNSEDRLKAGDAEGATDLLQRAQAEAEHSMEAAGMQVPRGWSDVSAKIRASSGKFKEAITDLLELLGGGNQSLGQQGVAANGAANTAAEDATRLARGHYAALGGAASDLPSIAQMSAAK